MSDQFGSEFFTGNRTRLRQLFTGTAPIVLTANGLLQKSADESFPFRQDSNFWYLTGCDVQDVVLVMDKAKEYLIVPEREEMREAFDGVIDIAALKAASGIDEVLSEKEGWRRLEMRLKRVQHVATLAANPPYIDFYGMYANPARANLIRRIKDIQPDIELLDLRTHLQRMRMVKQPAEIQALQQAIAITVDTLKDILRPTRLKKYAFEYQIEADLSHGFRRRGSSGHGFSPIVASGLHTTTMHYMDNTGPLASGDLLLLDVSATHNHYVADIARTVVIGDKTTRRQQQVIDAVVEAQDHALSLLKPGIILKDFETQMETYMGEKLRELGLLKTITSQAVRAHFPHRTSHYLGIDAHDAGDYEHPLEPDMVLAVEPGIYIPAENIGVRIEDNILITSDGNTVLSSKLPRVF